MLRHVCPAALAVASNATTASWKIRLIPHRYSTGAALASELCRGNVRRTVKQGYTDVGASFSWPRSERNGR